MTRPCRLEIDHAALAHNLKQVRVIAPHSSILAMVKANAYGHGVKQVANTLAPTDAFGVACIEEGLVLRAAGINKPIVLMEGFFSPIELQIIHQNNFEVVLHNHLQLQLLEQGLLPAKAIRVWIKIDTGMHRLGFAPAAINEVLDRLRRCGVTIGEIGLLTHFADADDLTKPTTAKQISQFNEVCEHITGPRSMANTAGILAWPASHANWVRPGGMLYGVSPFAGKTGADHGLKPVMTLHSEIIAIHQLKSGDAVGYGGKWICSHPMRVGVVAIGYGDGYPHHAEGGTPVLVNNKIVPLIGTVSMDMITVDLETQPKAKIGDPVVLWGQGLPVERIAQAARTISYELLCGVTERCKRS